MPDKVSLFATCVLNNFYPEVAISAARVLNRLGVEVAVEPSQTCCGQPFFNSGHSVSYTHLTLPTICSV